MPELKYADFKKDFKIQVDAVGYLQIMTNLAWELTVLRADVKKIKETLEFQNAH